MNLDGSAVLSATPDEVWAVITDPAVLARTIPGCSTLEQVGDDEYRMNVSVGVGAIRGLWSGRTLAGLAEGQALERFAVDRDPAAFEALVERHGPMVLGICRRSLRDRHDAEDAFQATFVVLARKAGGLRDRDALGHPGPAQPRDAVFGLRQALLAQPAQ